VSDARTTVERWVERFNAGDAVGISALYAEDAVNHQIALEPVVGRRAIEKFHHETLPVVRSPVSRSTLSSTASGRRWSGSTRTASAAAGSSRCATA